MKNTVEYADALNKAYVKCGHNAYFGNGFEAGYDFAMSQPKHIFDGVAVAGEVRRFKGELVDVVASMKCAGCVLFEIEKCEDFVNCTLNNVTYIKR